MRKLEYSGMTRVKVLQLEYWMDSDRLCKDDLDRLEPVVPVFNRDGYYYNRVLDVCWFEVDGKAYTTDVEMFIYTVQLLDAARLNHKQVEALRMIVTQRLATNRQQCLLRDYEHSMDNRRVYRDTRKYIMCRRKGGSK